MDFNKSTGVLFNSNYEGYMIEILKACCSNLEGFLWTTSLLQAYCCLILVMKDNIYISTSLQVWCGLILS